MRKKKRIILLCSCFFIFSTLVGCNLNLLNREKLQEEFNDEFNLEDNYNNNLTTSTIENKNLISFGNNNYYENIGKKYVYQEEIDCYELKLKDIGIYARIPNYILKDNFQTISNFGEIKIEKEKDFDNTYVISNNNDFTIFTPSGYLLIARNMETSSFNKEVLLKENLSNEDAKIIFNNIFQNSFIKENEENNIIQISKKGDTYILINEIIMYPLNGEQDSNYLGYNIIYINENFTKTLTMGACNFSYKDNVKKHICNYVINSSYIEK